MKYLILIRISAKSCKVEAKGILGFFVVSLIVEVAQLERSKMSCFWKGVLVGKSLSRKRERTKESRFIDLPTDVDVHVIGCRFTLWAWLCSTSYSLSRLSLDFRSGSAVCTFFQALCERLLCLPVPSEPTLDARISIF